MVIKKLSIVIASVAIPFTFTGCSNGKLLKAYNAFVQTIGAGDYSTALTMIDTSMCPFMNETELKESIQLYGSLMQGKETTKNDMDYLITTVDGQQIEAYLTKSNKLVLPELYTDLELYVPSGSSCTYNDVELDNKWIEDDDGSETTYEINSPISSGLLTISTTLFGDSEREVDPSIGDTAEFVIEPEYTKQIGDKIDKEINELSSIIDTGDVQAVTNRLSEYNDDADYVNSISKTLISNRKLDNPFVSYNNVVYEISNITASVESAEEIEASIDFNVNWKVGEDKEANAKMNAILIITKESDWKIKSIDDFSFMLLSITDGEVVNEN